MNDLILQSSNHLADIAITHKTKNSSDSSNVSLFLLVKYTEKLQTYFYGAFCSMKMNALAWSVKWVNCTEYTIQK